MAKVKWLAKYDVGRFQSAVQKVRDARDKVRNLPPKMQEAIGEIVAGAVEGTYEATMEIYGPKKEIERPGSDNDYETDKKILKDLPKMFR